LSLFLGLAPEEGAAPIESAIAAVKIPIVILFMMKTSVFITLWLYLQYESEREIHSLFLKKKNK
jgi:hypothetical protein